MGEEFEATGKPHVTAEVECTSPATSLVLFKNNEVVHERTEAELEGATHLTVDFTDEAFAGSAYYYIRVVQANGEIAWSSPVWADPGAREA